MTETLRLLEDRLLQPGERGSASDVSELLADDFVEFGSSGRIFDKKQIVKALRSAGKIQRSISDFKAEALAPGVILVTYIAVQYEPNGQEKYSLRSSAGNWSRINGK